jgi:hypothetical protein
LKDEDRAEAALHPARRGLGPLEYGVWMAFVFARECTVRKEAAEGLVEWFRPIKRVPFIVA